MKSAQLPRLIKSITDIGLTSAEVAETIHCTERSARLLINRLRKQNLVHIQEWTRSEVKGLPVAVYRYGIGIDAIKPMPASVNDRVRKWRRKESLNDKAFRQARERGRKVKIRRDPLVAAFYGESKPSN